MKNTNGTGNHGDDDKGNGFDDPKIAKFPTPAERREIEKLKAAAEAARQVAAEAQRKNAGGVNEPILNLPPAVKGVAALLVAVHLFMTFGPQDVAAQVQENLAFIPARYFSGDIGWQAILSPVTHMLLHAGWLHIGMNIAMLMAFGTGVERAIGGKKLFIILILSGIAGAFVHFAFVMQDGAGLVGASGGISGLFGAVMVDMIQQGRTERRGMAALLPVVLIWIGVNLAFGVFGMPGVSSQIAWTAHIGGFIAGLLLFNPVAKLKI